MNGTNLACDITPAAGAQPELVSPARRRAALRSFVAARQSQGVGHRLGTTVDRHELGGLPVTEGDGAGLTSSAYSRRRPPPPPRPDVASTLCCTSRSIPRDADRGQRAPIVVGMRITSNATSTTTRCPRRNRWRTAVASPPRVKDDRQPCQQDVQRDLVRRLLPCGALHQRDHPGR